MDEWGLWHWLNGQRYNGIGGLAMDSNDCELCGGTQVLTVHDYDEHGNPVPKQIPCPRH